MTNRNKNPTRAGFSFSRRKILEPRIECRSTLVHQTSPFVILASPLHLERRETNLRRRRRSTSPSRCTLATRKGTYLKCRAAFQYTVTFTKHTFFLGCFSRCPMFLVVLSFDLKRNKARHIVVTPRKHVAQSVHAQRDTTTRNSKRNITEK